MITSETLVALDREDPLAPFRDQFDLPEGIIYLDGNSLGPLPRRTLARLIDVTREEWGQSLITSWNKHGWIDLPQRIGDKIARIVGAAPGEVIAADSTSVNLFKLLAAACALRPDRKVILTEAGNFPTDIYMAEGLVSVLGGVYEVRTVAREDVAAAITDEVAVVMLTHVDYRTGATLDMASVTASAHAAGALMLWDLAHSAGAVPVDLNGAHADFAVGCGYKYLNGGPGAPAFLFVASRHHVEARQPLSGWMGHAAPFDFEDRYRPADGIRRHLAGTPAILGLVALEEGVDLYLEADAEDLRRKSVLMTECFAALVEQECGDHGLTLASPAEAAHRGSQVCFRHDAGYAIIQALISRGVIGDFRTPDILRFGLAPLYLRYQDLWSAVTHLRHVMDKAEWDSPEFTTKAAVT
ncbi:MAG: kynureninase [Paracoccaceae bacterium]|jgi:kynureninase